MFNMMDMMKQAQQLQSKMQDMHAELEQLEIEGEAGAGMVRVVLNGRGDMRRVTIDPIAAEARRCRDHRGSDCGGDGRCQTQEPGGHAGTHEAGHRRPAPAARAWASDRVALRFRCPRRCRSRSRTADPAVVAPARAGRALGAPRRAASDPEARAAVAPAGRRHGGRRGQHSDLPALRQHRYRRPVRHCAPIDRRATGLLCIVETVGDLWALERAQAVQGRYHILGGTLSPLDGVGPDDLNLAGLAQRHRRRKRSARSSWPSTPQWKARPPRTMSPICWRMPACQCRAWPMGCRWAESWTISMKAR
jgi:hypothetical protein